MTSMKDFDLAESMESELKRQGGVACYRVSDGQVMVFEAHLLRTLLEQAEGNEQKRVILFVKQGAQA